MKVGPMVDRNDQGAIIMAIVVAALFAAGAWIVPMTWYATADANRFVAVEHIDVQASNATEHTVNITYESQGNYPVRAEITLYRDIPNASVDKAVQTWTREGFLKPGEQTVSLQLTLSDKPPPGTYYYEKTVTFYPGYNTERTFTTRSDTFPLNQTADTAAVVNTTAGG